MKAELEETLAMWNSVARDWDIQVGDEGDRNRILNSDPVLWNFAGDVSGLDVLDAGCGTGYLTRKLRERGANVIGVDFSPEMIGVAREKAPDIDFRVDDCSGLPTIADDSHDLVIGNYVLMDTPDLDGAMQSFCRVLRAEGHAVLVFSHPCFPAGFARRAGEAVGYVWDFPYFENRKCVDPPWCHFDSDFIWFHRPLSDYWKAFRSAGFDVVDFDEPRITSDRYDLARNEEEIRKLRTRPFSVAFRLRKRCAGRLAG